MRIQKSVNTREIGERVRQLRKSRGITQDELANHLSVSRQAVSRWETGSSVPSIEILLKLSELYGITINEILEADITNIKYQKDIVFPGKSDKKKNVFGRLGKAGQNQYKNSNHPFDLPHRYCHPRSFR